MNRRWLLAAGGAVFVLMLVLRYRESELGREGILRKSSGVGREKSVAD